MSSKRFDVHFRQPKVMLSLFNRESMKGITIKKSLLNKELSYLVATLGHTDEITICDAGLRIPYEVTRIDLALTKRVPSFGKSTGDFV